MRTCLGIFEFIKQVDIIGNIVNNLPIIGPIRQQIMASFKTELDRTLGKQVKGFLGTYSRLATEQLVSLVLSEDNAAGFRSARRRLVEQILSRPVSSLVSRGPIERALSFLSLLLVTPATSPHRITPHPSLTASRAARRLVPDRCPQPRPCETCERTPGRLRGSLCP